MTSSYFYMNHVFLYYVPDVKPWRRVTIVHDNAEVFLLSDGELCGHLHLRSLCQSQFSFLTIISRIYS